MNVNTYMLVDKNVILIVTNGIGPCIEMPLLICSKFVELGFFKKVCSKV